ncbi:DUF4440 domain-containing protein [Algoriphagus hitonicola]|uniref:DUF4440 domain-containing protein n=1 Tax=Algoriphagus hitonicola TaxID=435880 RepID=A0A1I2RFP2_9BACT|nr:DUF4440 domain-containing protein [Algoriphagus hitonicola]SFG36681.1 protein of unknown function [Algoriphagus hitonicola]
MKASILLSLAILGFMSHPTFSQTHPEEKLIQNLIQDSFDDLFSGFKSEKILDYYTEDFLLLEQGEVWDNKMILAYFDRTKQNPSPSIRTNRFDFIETKVTGNTAWIAYHNYATFSQNGEETQQLYWLESATAIKTKKGWRLDMLHSTRVRTQE